MREAMMVFLIAAAVMGNVSAKPVRVENAVTVGVTL